MNQPKKLTEKQEEFLSIHSLNPADWCYLYETELSYVFVRKDSGQKKWIDKFGEEKTEC